MPSSKGLFPKVALFVCTVAVMSGCTPKRKSSSAEGLGSVLRVALKREIKTFDWHQFSSIDGVKELITEPLITYDPSHSKPILVPALVESWKPTEGGRKWTLQLRKNVKWSDGRELVAQEIVDSFERFLAPATGAFLASTFYVVKNVQAFNSGKLTDFSQVGIHSSSENQIKIELTRPVSYFPHLLTLFQLSPIRKDLIAKYPKGQWLKPENLVTVGPYLIENIVGGRSVRLKRNPLYYQGPRSIKNIEGWVVEGATAAVNLFTTGKLDVVFDIPSLEIQKLKKSPQFHLVPGTSPAFLAFDAKHGLGNDKDLRRAIAKAIDRKLLNRVFALAHPQQGILSSGFGISGLEVSPPELPSGSVLKKLKGKKLLLTLSTTPDIQRIGENLQFQLRESLGLEIELRPMEFAMFSQQVKGHQIPFYLYVMGPDYFDPHSPMEFFTTTSSQNISGWSSKGYDLLISRAEGELDEDKRTNLYRAADRLLREDATIIPLFAHSYSYLIADRVKGFKMMSYYRVDFRKAQLAAE